MRLLRHGQLEVETDLLLGVEEVLLPAGLDRASLARAGSDAAFEGDAVVETKPGPRPAAGAATPAGRGFESALVDATPAQRRSGGVGEAAPAVSSGGATGGAARPAANSAARQFTPPERQNPSAAEARAAGAASQGASATPSPSVGSGRPQHLVDRIAIPEGRTKDERLAALEADHARSCPHCTTATAHTRLVFGEGSTDAEIVFIGEAPGETDDHHGRPFMGEVGAKLDQMIRAMGYSRESVYLANIVKCRPPGDRTPTAGEIAACGPYLLAQLAIIAPKAVVTFGGPASKTLLASELGITRLRGEFGSVRLRSLKGEDLKGEDLKGEDLKGEDTVEVPLMPTTHPAQLLRHYTDEARAQIWSDLRQVLARLGRTPVR